MSELNNIECSVSQDGKIMDIEMPNGSSLWLTRNQALALLELIQEQLPHMAVDLSNNN